jgi:hypothetical protein
MWQLQNCTRLNFAKDLDSSATFGMVNCVGMSMQILEKGKQMQRLNLDVRSVCAVVMALTLLCDSPSYASDHLDTPSAIANPQADIGDIYAWTSSDGKQLNLVMDIVGKSLSNRIKYVLHVDSGRQFGKTTSTTTIVCRFPTRNNVNCHLGNVDYVSGDASDPVGLESHNHRFRTFAGLRDDPFFNNVRGTRAAYQTAIEALQNGTVVDAAGCPNFDQATSQAILDQWRHTDGGPAKDFLAGWTTSAIVISVDLDVVTKGGKLLAVWGTTSSPERQINRVGRPLTKQALLGTIAPDNISDPLKESYNAATPSTSTQFIPEIEQGLALYDGFDGKCGNQLLADSNATSSNRYRALATLLADDRLWVNSVSAVCTQLFAVELANLTDEKALRSDCGGRTPNYSASNVYRSLLVDGTNASVDDGVNHDDHEHSAAIFPFLAPPDPRSVPKQ